MALKMMSAVGAESVYFEVLTRRPRELETLSSSKRLADSSFVFAQAAGRHATHKMEQREDMMHCFWTRVDA